MKLMKLLACSAALMFVGISLAAEVKSGPQPGSGLKTFHPLNVQNAEKPDNNGKPACLV